MNVRKQIEVTKETREKLEKMFKTSRMNVWRALNFECDSPLCKRIRVAAKQNGGIVLMITPEVETIHDADGYMRQWFGNGAMLEVDKSSGRVDVYDRHGIKQAQIDKSCTVPQLYDMQKYAAAL